MLTLLTFTLFLGIVYLVSRAVDKLRTPDPHSLCPFCEAEAMRVESLTKNVPYRRVYKCHECGFVETR